MKKYLLTAAASVMILTASAQWTPQNAGFTNDTLGFYEMSIPNEQTAWAVCYDGKPPFLFSSRPILDFTRTIDGGNTWIPGKMGTDRTLRFSNISAINETDAWVAMHKINFSTGGGVYHTTDGGVTWEQSNPGELFDDNSFPNAVHFKDRNKGIAIGDPNGGYFEVYTTNNKGKKWKRTEAAHMPASLPNEYGWISGYAAVDNTVWFGTSLGRMFRSTNFGKDWTVSTVDPAGKTVYEIAFNDDGLHGVTHLRDFNNNTFLYTTSDGGITWTFQGQPINWKSSRITSVPGTNSFVATSTSFFDRGSSVSHDFGITWTVIDNAISKAVCRFYNATTGWAGSFFLTGPPLRPGIWKSEIIFPPAQQNAAGRSVTTNRLEATDINELVNVYPTPASDQITISFQDKTINTMHVISIINMNGKVVETKKGIGKLIQMDVSRIPSGSYTVRIASGSQAVNKIITIVR